MAECTFRDQTWGNIQFLHKRFCGWCDSHQSVGCSLQTFESLLREQFRFLLDQEFWTKADIRDGFIYGIVLAEDFKIGCIAHPDVLLGDADGFGFGVVDTRRSRSNQPRTEDSHDTYRVISRYPVAGPIRVSESETIHEPEKYVSYALRQLEAALAGGAWQSGNWPVPVLIERLKACGVEVEVQR